MYRFLLTALCILLYSQIPAQGYKITSYTINLELNKDGSVDVAEDIGVYFDEERRGIFRTVPRKAEYGEELRDIALTDVRINNEEFKIIRQGNDNVIRIGDPDIYLKGEKSYHLEYSLSNFSIYEEDHIPFQYNIVSGWDTTIDTVQYRLKLPEDIDLRYNHYRIITGQDGENERNATIEKSGSILTGHSLDSAPLDAGENITLAVRLPAGYLEPLPKEKSIFEKDRFWILPLGLMVWIIMFFKSRSRMDVEDIGEQYFPPDGLSPAEVGSYWDNKVNTEDIISLLPWWGDKGYIRIMGSGLNEDSELFFKKLKELPDNTPDYQKTIFEAIFQNQEMVILSELKNKIYGSISKASGELRKRLLNRELYDDNNYQLFHSGKMIGVALVLIIAAVLMFVLGLILTGIVSVLAAVIFMIVHFQSPKRSRKGALIQSQLLALKKFLEEDSGRKSYELMQRYPRYFEQLLPYAIAFGLDRSWLSRLEPYDVETPYWYFVNSSGTVNSKPDFGHFSQTFNVPQMKSVFVSRPASSSSSGGGSYSSGGGAGGGFGGGGGSW